MFFLVYLLVVWLVISLFRTCLLIYLLVGWLVVNLF